MNAPSRTCTPSSVTTGTLPLARTPSSSIGWLLGETGSAERRALATRTATALAPIRATAVPQDTERLDRTATLPQPLQSSLLVVDERTAVGDHGYEGTWPARIKVLLHPPPEVVAQARLALTGYRELCRPLAEEDLAMELNRLRAVTVARRDDQTDFAIRLDTLMDELALYPADLVLWAIRFWRRNEKYFPTPYELHLLIERRLGGRRAIMEALETLVARGEELP